MAASKTAVVKKRASNKGTALTAGSKDKVPNKTQEERGSLPELIKKQIDVTEKLLAESMRASEDREKYAPILDVELKRANQTLAQEENGSTKILMKGFAIGFLTAIGLVLYANIRYYK